MNNTPMNEEKAVAVLLLIKQVLDELNVEFTLACGALLGAVREGKFIAWDYDIDLATSEKYIFEMPEICEKLEEAGASTYYSEYNNVVAVYYDGVTVDLDFWRESKENKIMPMMLIENFIGKIIYFTTWVVLYTPCSHSTVQKNKANKVNYPELRYFLCKLSDKIFNAKRKANIGNGLNKLAKMTGNRRGLVKMPLNFYEGNKSIEFYGADFKIPSKTDEYLTTYYGSSWRVPNKNWEYVDTDKNIKSASQVNEGVWEYKAHAYRK